MNYSNQLYLASVAVAVIIGTLTGAQQIITAGNSNTNVSDSDLFLYDEIGEYEKDYSYVASLKYHLREEMLPQLITEITMQNLQCASQNRNLSLIDIAKAIQLSRYPNDELAEALGKLNITSLKLYNTLQLYNITPTLIENLLHLFGVTFSDIYKHFIESLATPSQTIPQILTTLNVSVTDFMNAHVFGNDTMRLRVLSTGNYSFENLNSVLKMTNKTPLDMLKFIPLDEIAKQLTKLNPDEFTSLAKNLGVTTENLIEFYLYLNVTPINFLSYSAFIHTVTDCYELINPEEVLGLIVSNNKLLTINRAKVFATHQPQAVVLIRNYADFHMELVENPLVQSLVKNINLTNPEYWAQDIAKVEIENPIITTFAEITKDYNMTALSNCIYVFKHPTGELLFENYSHVHLNNHNIVIPKTNKTLFNIGAPLFCNDKLVGMASEGNSTKITFSTFLKKMASSISPTTPTMTSGSTAGQQAAVSQSVTTSPNVIVSGPSSSVSMSYSVLNLLLAMVFLKFTYNY